MGIYFKNIAREIARAGTGGGESWTRVELSTPVVLTNNASAQDITGLLVTLPALGAFSIRGVVKTENTGANIANSVLIAVNAVTDRQVQLVGNGVEGEYDVITPASGYTYGNGVGYWNDATQPYVSGGLNMAVDAVGFYHVNMNAVAFGTDRIVQMCMQFSTASTEITVLAGSYLEYIAR